MRSTVNWAVLGLLIEKPSYGYEVGQRFERRFGEVLRAGTSHIYAALNRLQREMLIEPMPSLDAVGPRRQPKIHYRATAKGARAYRGWLAERMRDDAQRSEMLGRLLSTLGLDTEAMLEIVERYERECLEEASRIALPPREPSRSPAEAAHALMERLIAEERRIALQGQLMWIEYARREIRALAARAGGAEGAGAEAGAGAGGAEAGKAEGAGGAGAASAGGAAGAGLP